MKTCALCSRTTSPKSENSTSADAALCALCLIAYEGSAEYRREQYFLKMDLEGPARAALNDYVQTHTKTKQVALEREKNEKAALEVKAEAEKAAAEKSVEKSSKNGVEKTNGVVA